MINLKQTMRAFWIVLLLTTSRMAHAQSMRLAYFGKTLTHYGLTTLLTSYVSLWKQEH
ncbi:hypothetical protein [Dyadobacter alkalitolerans]|uniref:hypothetical protein n=1 Tax=Dyadobacter alkalitolerans TaxID=492736 RepID=UPI0012FC6E09|nr:hypothetical protein [Dyadobacter alkalitolerans]